MWVFSAVICDVLRSGRLKYLFRLRPELSRHAPSAKPELNADIIRSGCLMDFYIQRIEAMDTTMEQASQRSRDQVIVETGNDSFRLKASVAKPRIRKKKSSA